MKHNYELLKWDSENFGYSVAKIKLHESRISDLKKMLKHLRKSEIRLGYLFVDPQNKDANVIAKECGGSLVDQKVTLLKNLSSLQSINENSSVKSVFGKSLTARLRYLAFEAGLHSRFKTDANFNSEIFEKVYSSWIEKSLKGVDDMAHEVLVHTEKSRVNGLITLVKKKGKSNIGLLAVDPKKRGKGIGRLLIEAGVRWSIENKLFKMDVVTQEANEVAIKFYDRMGFKRIHAQNIYHFWI